MKNKAFVLAAIVLIIAGFFLLKRMPGSAPAPKPTATPGPSLAEKFVRPHSPSFGNTMGRATVVEWFDPECEACRAVHPFVKKIMDEYKDRVHFVLRYMPYHSNSMWAASALEEAKELGKFEEALNVLFEKQPEWADHHNPKPELMTAYLAQLGIPKEKLDKDYLIKKHGDKIKMDEADGQSLDVRGTPTFFINGQMLEELGEEPLRAAIEAALQ